MGVFGGVACVLERVGTGVLEVKGIFFGLVKFLLDKKVKFFLLLLNDYFDFDYSFSFIYSKRPGTPAAYLKDKTTNEQKLARLQEIQSINVTQGESYTKKMIGTTQRVLIDHFSKKKPGVLLGKTDNNRIIEFKESKDLLNKFVNVKVMEILGKSLVGELV